MTRQTGLTLVELMMTLAIAGLLLGLALPSLGALLERQRVAAAHNLLLASIQQARGAAIGERRPSVVCPSRDGLQCVGGGVWESGWMSFVDRNRNGVYDGDDRLLRHEANGVAGLRIVSGASRPQVRFHPSGRSAGSNLSIRICNREGQAMQAIVINNGGRARRAREDEIGRLAACG